MQSSESDIRVKATEIKTY
jgi:zinc transporter 2